MAERLMKETGIEWIGEIPESWAINTIGSLYSERKEKCSDTEYPPLSVTMQGVVPQLSTAAKTDAHDDRKLVRKGDFAINSRSDRRGSCGIAPQDGSVSLINTILKPKNNMNPGYYNWLFHSEMFSSEFYKWGHGIVNDLWTTNWQDMKAISVPVPTLEEQTRIADFLDKKVSEIDAVISKTKESIEEYKKLKQSIITEAVTKGLDPDAEMKDSGIEWIGKIPNNWIICKFKKCMSNPMMYGANESGVEYDEDLPRYIRITDITVDNKLKDTGKLSLTEESAKNYILKDKDLLFARSGGTVGKSFIYRSFYGRSAFAGYLIKATVDKLVSPEYVYFYTLTNSYSSWKDRIFIQATIQNIGADKYSNMELPVPSMKEQEQIVEFLDDQCSKYDSLISKKEQVLIELEQYKKSLIYEYVTGKKEVA